MKLLPALKPVPRNHNFEGKLERKNEIRWIVQQYSIEQMFELIIMDIANETKKLKVTQSITPLAVTIERHAGNEYNAVKLYFCFLNIASNKSLLWEIFCKNQYNKYGKSNRIRIEQAE